MISMHTYLKPCPFCGNNAIFEYAGKGMSLELHEKWSERTLSFVTCSYCGALVSGATEQDAISRWNMRAKDREGK